MFQSNCFTINENIILLLGAATLAILSLLFLPEKASETILTMVIGGFLTAYNNHTKEDVKKE